MLAFPLQTPGKWYKKTDIIKEKDGVMKYGARNKIFGEVESIKEGTVMCEVILLTNALPTGDEHE